MGKRQDFIDLYRSGKGTRQKYIDLSGNYFRRKSMQGVHDPFKPLTILDMLKSGAFARDLKHGGIASLAPRRGRVVNPGGYAGDEDKDRSWIPSFMDKILNRMEGSTAQLEDVMEGTEEPISMPVEKEPEWEPVDMTKYFQKSTGWSSDLFMMIKAHQKGGASADEIVESLYPELNRENSQFREDMGVTTYGNKLKEDLRRYSSYNYPLSKAQGGLAGILNI